MMESTTDLKALRSGRGTFTWGKIAAWHEIGSYTIAEYIERNTHDVSFHVWVDGENTSHSFTTLEHAIVGAIAYKAEGPNHAADRYFIKALGL